MDLSLDDLVSQWLAHKFAENRARTLRVEVEGQIVAACADPERDEGSCTVNTGIHKISVTKKLNRKLDTERWEEIAGDFPLEASPVRTKYELDLPKMRALSPDLYEMFSDCLTTKPAKPYVTVEEL